MELYVVPGSPSCRKVCAVAQHLGLALELRPLDPAAGELRNPAHLGRNPNGMVPVLKDGDFLLWESNAILHYLAEQRPEAGLLPSEARPRAEVQRWLFWEAGHFNKAFGALLRETVLKPRLFRQEPDPAQVGWAQAELARYAPVLDRHMAIRRHAVGASWTLADYALGYHEAYRDAVPFDWRAFPALGAYFDRLRDSPHWRACAPVG